MLIQNNNLQNQDILHHIMLQSDIGSTNAMLRTNKLASKANNEENFWMIKLINDYPLNQKLGLKLLKCLKTNL